MLRAVGAAGVCAAVLAASSPSGAEADDDLERLRLAIEEARTRVATYEREERGLLEALEALEVSVELLRRDVLRAQRQAAEARAALATVEAEAVELAVRLEQTRGAMSVRAVALYKAGDAASVRMLFAAGGVRDFLSRVQSLRLLLAHDADLLTRYRGQERALEGARERAARAAAVNEEAAAALTERRARLDAERAVKLRLARRLGQDRARERSALTELETAARALEETLGALREAGPLADRPAGPPFASLRGQLPPPVRAPLVSGFGRVRDAQHSTLTFRKGLDFAAAYGDVVRAVAAGRVRYAGWFRGYGRMLILDHGDDYFTVSGHLAEFGVEVGDAVAAGEAVGMVGDTGSLGGPRLYFEIRRGATPLNPAEWLETLDESPKGG